MSHLCCIPICPNSKADRGVVCFPFPAAVERRIQWVDFVGDDPSRFRWRTKYLCADHFLQSELLEVDGEWQLSDGAVPMIYSPEDDEADELMDRDDVMVSEEPSKLSPHMVDNPTDKVDEPEVEAEPLDPLFCRICLKKATDLIPLKSKLHKASLVDMIFTITGLKIDTGEGLPKNICGDCVGKVDLAFNIRMEFVQHERYLRNLVDTDQLQSYYELYETGAKRSESLNAVYLDGLMKQVKSKEVTDEPMVVMSLNVDVVPDQKTELVKSNEDKIVDDSSVQDGSEVAVEDDDDLNITGDSETEEHAEGDDDNRNSKDNPGGDQPKYVFSWKELYQPKPKPADKKPPERKIDEYRPKPTLVPHTCYVCDTANADAEALETHMEQHVDILPYRCDQCSTEQVPQVFKSLVTLNRHLVTHLYPYPCDYCPLRHLTQTAYIEHMNEMHLASDGFTCDYCGQFFTRRRQFYVHWKKHKAIENETFKCEHCGKLFGCGNVLRRHVLIHTGETPYECKKCGKRYRHPDHYLLHKRKHIGELGYSCEMCGENFINSTALRKHMLKRGTTECRRKPSAKVHSCPHCEKIFRNKQKLDRHVDGHENIRRHKCQYCEKAFVHKDNCKAHERTHTGERPHVCRACPKAFITASARRKHEKTHPELKVESSSESSQQQAEETVQSVDDMTNDMQEVGVSEDATELIDFSTLLSS